ncbi:MAG: hypothetical protein QXW83_01295 [Nitrososphaerales archaeon]
MIKANAIGQKIARVKAEMNKTAKISAFDGLVFSQIKIKSIPTA